MIVISKATLFFTWLSYMLYNELYQANNPFLDQLRALLVHDPLVSFLDPTAKIQMMALICFSNYLILVGLLLAYMYSWEKNQETQAINSDFWILFSLHGYVVVKYVLVLGSMHEFWPQTCGGNPLWIEAETLPFFRTIGVAVLGVINLGAHYKVEKEKTHQAACLIQALALIIGFGVFLVYLYVTKRGLDSALYPHVSLVFNAGSSLILLGMRQNFKKSLTDRLSKVLLAPRKFKPQKCRNSPLPLLQFLWVTFATFWVVTAQLEPQILLFFGVGWSISGVVYLRWVILLQTNDSRGVSGVFFYPSEMLLLSLVLLRGFFKTLYNAVKQGFLKHQTSKNKASDTNELSTSQTFSGGCQKSTLKDSATLLVQILKNPFNYSKFLSELVFEEPPAGVSSMAGGQNVRVVKETLREGLIVTGTVLATAVATIQIQEHSADKRHVKLMSKELETTSILDDLTSVAVNHKLPIAVQNEAKELARSGFQILRQPGSFAVKASLVGSFESQASFFLVTTEKYMQTASGWSLSSTRLNSSELHTLSTADLLTQVQERCVQLNAGPTTEQRVSAVHTIIGKLCAWTGLWGDQ